MEISKVETFACLIPGEAANTFISKSQKIIARPTEEGHFDIYLNGILELFQ